MKHIRRRTASTSAPSTSTSTHPPIAISGPAPLGSAPTDADPPLYARFTGGRVGQDGAPKPFVSSPIALAPRKLVQVPVSVPVAAAAPGLKQQRSKDGREKGAERHDKAEPAGEGERERAVEKVKSASRIRRDEVQASGARAGGDYTASEEVDQHEVLRTPSEGTALSSSRNGETGGMSLGRHGTRIDGDRVLLPARKVTRKRVVSDAVALSARRRADARTEETSLQNVREKEAGEDLKSESKRAEKDKVRVEGERVLLPARKVTRKEAEDAAPPLSLSYSTSNSASTPHNVRLLLEGSLIDSEGVSSASGISSSKLAPAKIAGRALNEMQKPVPQASNSSSSPNPNPKPNRRPSPESAQSKAQASSSSGAPSIAFPSTSQTSSAPSPAGAKSGPSSTRPAPGASGRRQGAVVIVDPEDGGEDMFSTPKRARLHTIATTTLTSASSLPPPPLLSTSASAGSPRRCAVIDRAEGSRSIDAPRSAERSSDSTAPKSPLPPPSSAAEGTVPAGAGVTSPPSTSTSSPASSAARPPRRRKYSLLAAFGLKGASEADRERVREVGVGKEAAAATTTTTTAAKEETSGSEAVILAKVRTFHLVFRFSCTCAMLPVLGGRPPASPPAPASSAASAIASVLCVARPSTERKQTTHSASAREERDEGHSTDHHTQPVVHSTVNAVPADPAAVPRDRRPSPIQAASDVTLQLQSLHLSGFDFPLDALLATATAAAPRDGLDDNGTLTPSPAPGTPPVPSIAHLHAPPPPSGTDAAPDAPTPLVSKREAVGDSHRARQPSLISGRCWIIEACRLPPPPLPRSQTSSSDKHRATPSPPAEHSSSSYGKSDRTRPAAPQKLQKKNAGVGSAPARTQTQRRDNQLAHIARTIDLDHSLLTPESDTRYPIPRRRSPTALAPSTTPPPTSTAHASHSETQTQSFQDKTSATTNGNAMPHAASTTAAAAASAQLYPSPPFKHDHHQQSYHRGPVQGRPLIFAAMAAAEAEAEIIDPKAWMAVATLDVDPPRASPTTATDRRDGPSHISEPTSESAPPLPAKATPAATRRATAANASTSQSPPLAPPGLPTPPLSAQPRTHKLSKSHSRVSRIVDAGPSSPPSLHMQRQPQSPSKSQEPLYPTPQHKQQTSQPPPPFQHPHPHERSGPRSLKPSIDAASPPLSTSATLGNKPPTP
ncbi:hypothetical protein BN946_scf184912.g58 [Trametes cinnabarina]|uniref:Uncharacterized protein n=1 Tax=Pycnoporus cinnabarinus TaxID=5643 RepID=A0A060SZ58_PYCCI|nr:hypothetical protein BN946_scf184912.g58 [Trametes cinnabarina]